MNQYELLEPFDNKNAGFSRWTCANKNGRTYFLKEFLDPVYPTEESLSSELCQQRIRECEEYEKYIDLLGGMDIQVLGIGQNGHIGFNEPDSFLYSDTHVTGLTDSTMQANARFFSEDEVMPTKALTMGMGSIFKARKIIVMANGKAKRDAVRKLISGKITTECPVTFLNLHSDVTLICDKLAIED